MQLIRQNGRIIHEYPHLKQNQPTKKKKHANGIP